MLPIATWEFGLGVYLVVKGFRPSAVAALAIVPADHGFTGSPGEVWEGSVAKTVWGLTGPLYMLGPLLFGIATLRAGILSRWAAGLFGFGAVASILFAFVPPDLEPLATVPIGLGWAWLGYSLWSERRGQVAEPVTRTEVPQPRPAGAR